jgi:hypothetical protein
MGELPPSVLSMTLEDQREADRQLVAQYGVETRNAWIRAIGNGWTQQHTFDRATLISAIHHGSMPLFRRNEAIQSLAKMPRKQAYRMLATLPIPLLNHAPDDISELEVSGEQAHWVAIAGWLLYWESESKPLKLMLDQVWAGYEPRARISELRFQMIRKLVDDGQLYPDTFTHPGLPWLLCEVSSCRQRLNNVDVPTAKQRFYESRKAHIDSLQIINPIDIRQPTDFDDFLNYFDQVVEVVARKYAEHSPQFDRQYLRPYLSAGTVWNKNLQKDKTFQPVRAHNQRDRKPAPL